MDAATWTSANNGNCALPVHQCWLFLALQLNLASLSQHNAVIQSVQGQAVGGLSQLNAARRAGGLSS